MLVDEHTYTDATHVETVQEVLNAVLCTMLNAMCLLQLQNSLKNCTHVYLQVSLITTQRMGDTPCHQWVPMCDNVSTVKQECDCARRAADLADPLSRVVQRHQDNQDPHSGSIRFPNAPFCQLAEGESQQSNTSSILVILSFSDQLVSTIKSDGQV